MESLVQRGYVRSTHCRNLGNLASTAVRVLSISGTWRRKNSVLLHERTSARRILAPGRCSAHNSNWLCTSQRNSHLTGFIRLASLQEQLMTVATAAVLSQCHCTLQKVPQRAQKRVVASSSLKAIWYPTAPLGHWYSQVHLARCSSQSSRCACMGLGKGGALWERVGMGEA